MATRKEREEKPEKSEPKNEKPDVGMEDTAIEVEVEPEEEEPEEVVAGGEDEDDDEPRQTRREKKRARGNAFREAQEARAAAEARVAALEAERQQFFQQQQMAAAQAQAQQQSQTELEKVYEDQKTLYAAFEAAQRAGQMSDFDAREWERKAREIEQRKYLAIARQGGMGQQVNPQQIANYVEYQQIQTRYADIYGNQAARSWAEGRLHQLAAEKGMPQNKAQLYALIEEAAEETRSRFGLGTQRRRPAPDAATRARYSGVPARGNGGGGETVRVPIGRAQKALARSLYPNDSEEVAVKKWAKGPGRRAALAESKSR